MNGRTRQRKGKVTTSPRKNKEEARARKHIQVKGNQNQDQAGSPNEDGQRTLGDFGVKSQWVEFVGDVQENADFESPCFDRAICVSCDQKCNSVSMDPTELPSSRRESAMGMRSQRALIKNSISQRERYFSPLDVEMINQLLILEVLCPPVQWLMRHRFRLRKCNTVWIWGWSSLICVSGSWCAYMCVSVWVHFGSILGPFWVHFGSILGPFWVHFGSILGPFLGPFLGPMGVQWGSIWGMFCVHFGSILGPFCLLSECWRILKVQGFNQHSNKNRYLNKNQYLHKNQ